MRSYRKNKETFNLINILVKPKFMKFIIICLCLTISGCILAQSKKVQIQTLTMRLDSLKKASDTERNFNNIAIVEQKTKIINYEKQISSLNTTLFELNKDLSFKSTKLVNLDKQIDNLNTVIRLKSDSIKLLIDSKSHETDLTEFGIQINYTLLNKPDYNSLEDWLSQFTLVAKNKFSYTDNDLANYYAGGDTRVDLYGEVIFIYSMYREGIVFLVRGEHERASYQLFIPLITISDAKKNIENLCKKMGYCITPEKMKIDFFFCSENVKKGLRKNIN
jgi:hypothetical protein